MKKIFVSLTAVAVAFAAMADLKVGEPEFVNSYIHLTSDSTFNKLPKETGSFKKHESKFGKIAKVAGSVADVAGTAAVGAAWGGSVKGTLTGLQAMNAASGVANTASSLNLLAGYEGMDIVFDGGESSYGIKMGENVRIIYRAESNDTDPADFLRVVQFKKGKKDRKIRWMNLSYSLLGGEKERKNGYVPFEATKFGETSYLITIPAEYLQEGEYGIVSPALVDATALPIATFKVEK
ncbi:MAG: hypothetical protein NC095_03605 [Muribaculum sp.]|nr:hypothetical protein [Muribaculum sp.]